jgi:hypothetical protein
MKGIQNAKLRSAFSPAQMPVSSVPLAFEKLWAMNLKAALPALLPLATEWAEARAREGADYGVRLSDRGIAIARAVGVKEPRLIRVALVQALPLPEHPGLRAAAVQTGLLGPQMVGLTLGYSVFVCRGHQTPRLLAHELRHVYQYEAAGSIASFLPLYLMQIIERGYYNAPFEIDARRHEHMGKSAKAGVGPVGPLLAARPFRSNRGN